MPNKRVPIRLIILLAVASGFVTTASSADAADERLLHSFCHANRCADGYSPSGGLIFDSSGSLYGTAGGGGVYGYGTVFRLTRGAHGEWTQKVLHNFNLADGAFPQGDLIFGADGNLYGTTYEGGAFSACDGGDNYACGTVFRLALGTNGKWKHTVLHSFAMATTGFGLPPA